MADSTIQRILERAEENRMEEIISGRELGEDSGGISNGENKEVFITQRNTVGKIQHNSSHPSGSSSDTDDIEGFPWAVLDVRDLSEIGLEREETLIEMRRSDMSHEEAVDAFGIVNVISRDLDMFIGLLDDGRLYKDFKHQNIGYFNRKTWRPEPVDIFDREALDSYSGDPQEVAKSIGLYLRGNDVYDGIADKYNISLNRAEREVFEYLGLEISETTGRPFEDLCRVLYDLS